ncbi:response regulator [Tunicatimonas pelagia]|uniref:response regulator n=1 Tax=Tunicatimonas pelagia TaxID=931531 RepID=UPI00266682D3|nr:response regulator [Tunicatimonas pelagia]WKN45804.1 response regulator [Tunicatimonas pelagia]
MLALERNKALADRRTIEAQARELQELHDFRSHFFANISHEIRTPLTLVSGYARRLSESAVGETNQQHAKIIAEKSADIKELVDSIIDLSKLDNKGLTLQRTSVNLSQLLQKVHADFSDIFSQQTINLTLDIPDRPIFIDGDAVLMNRAITNLIINALKFTHQGGVTKLILQVEDEALLKIYNTGIGIPWQDVDRIFDRFYQVKNDITRSQGSGIGLSITRAILEQHDYYIQVASEVNRYAQFTIRFMEDQFWQGDSTATEVPHSEITIDDTSLEENAPPLSPSSTKTILLVEDNQDMRRFILSIPAISQYTVLEAVHGEEALQLLEKHDVDIIITDYMMPRMDGLKLIHELKQRNYKQPIVVITAQADQQRKLDMLRVGIDGYLTKPFSEEELSILIDKLLEQDSFRKQFIAQQLRENQTPLLPDELAEFNQRLRSVIDENIGNKPFGVPELCAQLDLTERTLYRKVKELCGSTPTKLITERRLLRAKAYYDQGNYKSTQQLAFSVGFKNSTRFAEKFRTRFGIKL